METDARTEILTHRPLLLDQRAQRGVVGIGHVFLEAERGRDEVDLHPQSLTEREHNGRGLGGGEAGQFVDREFAQVGPADGGREKLGARGGVFLVADFHLLQRRPDVGEEPSEFGFIQSEASFRHPCLHRRDERGRDMGCDPPAGVIGDGRLREFGREIERDVAREHTPGDERVFTRVKFSADGLVVRVEAPRNPAAVKTGFQFREHATVTHAFDALTLVALGHVGADERKRHRVELTREHDIGVVDELTRNRILVRRHAETQRAHRPLDGRPVQGRETCADPERAAPELFGGGGENRRGRVVRLDEVLQFQQVRKGRGKHRRAIRECHRVVQRIRFPRIALQSPRAVALDVFHQSERARGRPKSALRVNLHRLAGAELVAQRRPIETKVGRHAGIRRDAKFVFEEEAIDCGHR